MKITKFLFFILYIISFLGLNLDKHCANSKDRQVLDFNFLKEDMIRFHVIANSNSELDQKIKFQLKDVVVDYLNNNVDLTFNKDENIKNLKKNIKYIEKICYDEFRKLNYDKKVEIKFEDKYFEERVYGDYIIPEGVYDSFVIYIGDGKGKNFWSMIFSNIGFISGNDEKSDIDSMINLVKDNESKTVEVSNNSSNKNISNVKISFKIVELVTNFFKKIF